MSVLQSESGALAEMADGDVDFMSAVRLGWFENVVGFHLRKAQEAAFAAFKNRVGGFDVRVGHFAALVLIDENTGINQTDLGKAMGRDKSSLTPVLDDLTQRGLVVRQRSSRDRRRYGLSLSAQGRELCACLQRQAAVHEEHLVRLIEPDDVQTFLRVLKRIATIMPEG